ncbi:hypothetical protein HYPSUDRAFT_39838 [Hypholoma sublateritium FD-334 SS-4]|uniref:Uncharacterized protein n=1 Tax=Hypholoma sublateritium (strain FD-334 SS-4) TaxID=945553 RepID=A0A0D2NY24_HYPSF|nr:hypothetical protein HYPSUDRAFT_39838 [Hypholoma sublateritium FD-334 SS-4]
MTFFIPAGAGSFCFRIAAPASIVRFRMSRPPHVLQEHTHGPLPNLIHAEGLSLLHKDVGRQSSMQSFDTPCETMYEHRADTGKPEYMRRIGCGSTHASSRQAYCGALCHCLVKNCTLTEGFCELQLRGSGCGRGDQCSPPLHTLSDLVAHRVSAWW